MFWNRGTMGMGLLFMIRLMTKENPWGMVKGLGEVSLTKLLSPPWTEGYSLATEPP